MKIVVAKIDMLSWILDIIVVGLCGKKGSSRTAVGMQFQCPRGFSRDVHQIVLDNMLMSDLPTTQQEYNTIVHFDVTHIWVL